MLPLHPPLLSQPDYLFSPNRRRGRGGAKAPSSPPCHFPRHRGCDPAHCPGGSRRPAHRRRRTGYPPKKAKGYGPACRLSLPAGGHCRPVRGPALPHPAGGSYRYRGQQRKPWGRSFPCGSPACRSGLRSGLPRLPGPGRSRRAPGFSLPCRAENDFLPQPEEAAKPGLIVLCTPNNPTGAALSLVEMTEWVNWANRTGSLLLVDTAYAAFLSGRSCPQHLCRPRRQTLRHRGRLFLQIRWLYRGSVRLGHPAAGNRLRRSLAALAGQPQQWHQLSHPAGRGGRPFPPPDCGSGKGPLPLYRQNAATMLQMFHKLGLTCAARRPGCLAPYLWVRCPDGPDAQNSWAWFHRLLEGCGVLCAPGSALGRWARAGCGLPPFPSRRTLPKPLRRMEHFLR